VEKRRLASIIALFIAIFIVANGCNKTVPPAIESTEPISSDTYTTDSVTGTSPNIVTETAPESSPSVVSEDTAQSSASVSSADITQPPPSDTIPEITQSSPPETSADTTESSPVTTTPTPTTAPPETSNNPQSVTIVDSSIPTGSGPASTPRPATINMPKASGTSTSTTDKSVIDYSHTSDGYIMVKYTGSRQRIILQIVTPSGTTYKYHLPTDGSNNSFPLSAGNGSYTVQLFEGNAGTTVVSPVDNIVVTASISNTNTPFLMPNFYVNYTANSTVVTKASELSAGSSNELDRISAVYNWFVDNVVYDDHRAENVRSGYVPDLAELMRDKKGICFDYSSGMTAMLRSQGIPTKLEEGYAGDIYHAWITTFSSETGQVNSWIIFDGSRWTLMEPTFAAVNGDTNTGFRAFVNNRSNYTTLFQY